MFRVRIFQSNSFQRYYKHLIIILARGNPSWVSTLLGVRNSMTSSKEKKFDRELETFRTVAQAGHSFYVRISPLI
jgi:hypothetical protein